MPKKFRLIRTDVGVLDLTQVLDDQGRPLLLRGKGAEVVVAEHALKHPLVARYIDAGIEAVEIPVQVPSVPVASGVPAPPPTPPVAKPAPVAPPVRKPEPVMVPEPTAVSVVPEVIIPDPPPPVEEPSTDTESAPVAEGDDDDAEATVRRRGKASGRKRSRNR